VQYPVAGVVQERRATSIGYHGNVVSVWEALVTELEAEGGSLLADLGSDQAAKLNHLWPFFTIFFPQSFLRFL
jgi:urocanate hydratase